MSLQVRSSALLDFEETRPAPHFTGVAADSPPMVARSHLVCAASRGPAPPLPQDTWLLELPELEPEPERFMAFAGWRWPRIAGLAVAALLTLFALGLAASLLDAQHLHGGDGGMRFAATARL